VSILLELGEKLLEIKNLKKYFPVKGGLFNNKVEYVKAVDDVSLTANKGEVLGLVGESGCGKSTIGKVILRLLDATSGEVFLKGKNIFLLNKKEMRNMRKQFQIIFQDPYASLNPRMNVEQILEEPLDIFKLAKNKKEKKEKLKEMLESVGLKKEYLKKYPHEFSGGQRQRIVIARALSVKPEIIIADEPVSALDVSIQAQIINLMQDLQEEFHLTYIFISHDLSVIKHICNRVAVMYLGKIVEVADKVEFFANPLHPYTHSLLSSIPIIDFTNKYKRKKIIPKGDVPSPKDPPSGCRFHPRCPEAMKICSEIEPEFKEHKDGHFSGCHLLD